MQEIISSENYTKGAEPLQFFIAHTIEDTMAQEKIHVLFPLETFAAHKPRRQPGKHKSFY